MMSTFEKEQFVDLCIAFFQGDSVTVGNLPVAEGKYGNISILIKEYREEVNKYSTRDNIPSRTSQHTRKVKINRILSAVKEEVDNKNKPFWDERQQHYPRYLSVKNNRNDMSRKLDYLTGCALYLLRGYCKYILRGELMQDDRIMWVDKSMNDLMQAFYLANAVYLSFSHDVRRGLYSSSPSDGMMRRLAWLLVFVDIFKGNIYYKIYDYKGAFESYCSGITKHNKIKSSYGLTTECEENIYDVMIKNNDNISNLYNKTFVKVYNEKAKCYFKHGNFYDAFKWHLKSLSDILALSLYENHRNKVSITAEMISSANVLRCSLYAIIAYMDNEKDQHILLKREIIDLFVNKPGLDPVAFRDIVTDQYKYIASDIFARIGFLLYTLKISELGQGYHNHANSVEKNSLKAVDENRINNEHAYGYIFKFRESVWESKFDSSYTAYLRLITGEKNVSPDLAALEGFDEPEKIFAALTLQELSKQDKADVNCDIKPFVKLGISSMVNIDNIVTLPRMLKGYLMREGYEHRAKGAKSITGDGSTEKKEYRHNKFVVLRRWQSFNPKIPRPRYKQVLGGGYYLHWQGKGIVIDPGYNFIQNFYNEGFSMEDIDAVLVTHSHADHDDELSTIMTLMFEWNEHRRKAIQGEGYKTKELDLFLNEGSYRKYSSWLYAPKSIVKKIYMLQNNAWNRGIDIEKTKERLPRSNCVIDLRNEDDYHMTLEVVPAWHDEIIGKHMAIGVKFRLYNKFGRRNQAFVLGITGDTYDYTFKDGTGIAEQYNDCQMLVAHLGDVKMKEIVSRTKIKIIADLFLRNLHKFNDVDEFLSYMGLLDIEFSNVEKEVVRKLWDDSTDAEIENDAAETIIDTKIKSLRIAYKYPNHLGLQGVLNLLNSMKDAKTREGGQKKLFILGEFPEELGSYKQMVARVLNNFIAEKGKGDKIRCMTGDVGLHVQISKGNNILVRCHKCNQNNELIRKERHYHSIDDIQETIVKRDNNGMVYLCHSLHALWPENAPKSFLSFMPGNSWGQE